MKKERRNDAPWRTECLLRRGEFCRCCRIVWPLEIDHVMPRSQGGMSVVENGLVLCRACHAKKTERRMLVRREWLDGDQVEWLAAQGWVAWDDSGEPSGRGWRGFAPYRQETRDD